MSGQPGRHDEPRGIARYFQTQTRGAQDLPPQGVPVPSYSPASYITEDPSSGAPRPISSSNTPVTPSLLRTPSRVAVIINSASQQQTSQPTSRDASEESLEGLVTSDINPPRRMETSTVPSLTPRNLSSTTPNTQSSTTPRPRGRPPSTHTKPRGRPPSTVPNEATTTTTPSTQTQTPATQPPKRRGRPLGWRAGMGSYSATASSAAGAPVPKTAAKERTGPPKKRGRPPGRPGTKPPRAIFEKLRPKYVPFLCEWEGCPAELQNIDTLRRHVRVVHGRQGVRSCRWGKCSLLPRESFASGAEFERHMEVRHLLPFVWHVGDGPRNTIMEYKVKTPDEAADDLLGYLFDEDGNQVTPSVLHQQFENDEERKERRRRLHRLLLERDRNAPEEELMSEHEGDERVEGFGK
ncbi:hypothetical protein BR93DRAFT_663396 [Coniochaeta sp. PMI_546]|nr:hypothetical protein BR93DRAFT_663396 [Coniochaeta sp. PMI_546]